MVPFRSRATPPEQLLSPSSRAHLAFRRPFHPRIQPPTFYPATPPIKTTTSPAAHLPIPPVPPYHSHHPISLPPQSGLGSPSVVNLKPQSLQHQTPCHHLIHTPDRLSPTPRPRYGGPPHPTRHNQGLHLPSRPCISNLVPNIPLVARPSTTDPLPPAILLSSPSTASSSPIRSKTPASIVGSQTHVLTPITSGKAVPTTTSTSATAWTLLGSCASIGQYLAASMSFASSLWHYIILAHPTSAELAHTPILFCPLFSLLA